MRYSTVLFDFDGTLADSIELILESYRQTMNIHRPGQHFPDSLWLEGLGTPLRVQFKSFTQDPVEVQSMIATYREWNLTNHDRMVTPYPGALDTVRALKNAGLRLGIVSSKNRGGIDRGISHCGFENLFESFVCADTMELCKPDPAPVRHAMEMLGGTPETTLFVGDSPHDIAAGRDAGTDTAACLWGPFARERLERERPTYWVKNFEELRRLILPL